METNQRYASGWKGVSQFLSAVLLLVMAVAIAAFVASWITNFSYERSAAVENTTSLQLQCQSANLYIKSVRYNCSSSCAAGTVHSTTVTIVNSGKVALGVDKIYVQNTTGSLFVLELNQTYTIDPGITRALTNMSTDTCNGINKTIDKVIVNSAQCPNTAFDSLRGSEVAFVDC